VKLRAVAVSVAAAVTLAIVPALPAFPVESSGTHASELLQARRATAKFHTLSVARAAGYQKFLACFDDPEVGGMGQHFARKSLIDDTIDALHPEVLVYEPGRAGYRLVGLEYVVPQSAKWTDKNPPMLFGHHFHRNDTLGIWALHAWVWRPNPVGMHADYNPFVRMCP
jgi:hypothetical protein